MQVGTMQAGPSVSRHPKLSLVHFRKLWLLVTAIIPSKIPSD